VSSRVGVPFGGGGSVDKRTTRWSDKEFLQRFSALILGCRSLFEPSAAGASDRVGVDLRPTPRARIDEMIPQTRGPELDPAHGAPVLAGRHVRAALGALERHLGSGGKSDFGMRPDRYAPPVPPAKAEPQCWQRSSSNGVSCRQFQQRMRGKVPSDFMIWSTSRRGFFAPWDRCRNIVDPCAMIGGESRFPAKSSWSKLVRYDNQDRVRPLPSGGRLANPLNQAPILDRTA